MEFRLLTTKSELAAYRDSYHAFGGVQFPEAYLKTAEVTGGFDRENRMVAGYLVAPGTNMRWPTLLENRCEFLESIDGSEIVELNGVWIAPSLRGDLESIAFWTHVGRHMSRLKVKAISYAVDSRKSGLLKLYSRVISRQIYYGTTNFSSIPNLVVFYSTPWRFLLFRFVHFREWIARLRRGLWAKRNRLQDF